jgi:hypothetical protein
MLSAFNIQHPTSNIQHPTSSIQHPTSSIQHPAFNIQHSDIQELRFKKNLATNAMKKKIRGGRCVIRFAVEIGGINNITYLC